MMASLLRALFFGSILALGPGCERPDRQYEDYELQSPADLTLSPTNHPHGYARRECYTCHLPHNIHQRDTLGDPLFDSARDLVDQFGLKSCAGCHGGNGVTP